jgi:hypothetical protein
MQALLLELEDSFLAFVTQPSIPKVPLSRIIFSNETFNNFRRWCFGLKLRRGFNEELWPFVQPADNIFGMLRCGMACHISVDRIDDGILEMSSRLVPVDPRQLELLKDGGNVVVLELDGAIAPLN